MVREMTLDDLKAAAYNPRTITPVQREALRKSLIEYGDLSGIIFNRKTGNLVGGHQRLDLFRKAREAAKVKVVRNRHTDNKGTIAIGYVEIPDGKTPMRIPYREVNWDNMRERAANIAANSGGGSFDHVKLGRVFLELENKKYPIEMIPIDTLELKRATRMFEHLNRKSSGIIETGDDLPDVEVIRGSLSHCCPKCGHRWSGAAAPNQDRQIASKSAKVRAIANESRVNDRPRKIRPQPSKSRSRNS